MTSNNINKTNVLPFLNTQIANIQLNNILSDDNFGLPLIPGIYFVNSGYIGTVGATGYTEENGSSGITGFINKYSTNITIPPLEKDKNYKLYKYDNIGTKSISAYYNIKNSINNLKTIKKYIIDILTTNKKLFESVNVSKETYKLNKKNIIYKFNQVLQDNFTYKPDSKSKITMPLLIDLIVKNKYSIIKNRVIKSNSPDFMYIFQNEYKGISKTYFYDLFKEYDNERNKLVKYIKQYYGILAFNYIFELNNKLDIKMNNMVIPNKNLNNFKFIEGNYKQSNSNFSVGDIVNYSNISNSKIPPTPATIIQINYNNPEKPYTIKIQRSTGNKILSVSNTDIKQKQKTKPSLGSKIHNFNLLYESVIGEQTIKSNYQTKINKIYNDFYLSIDTYLSGNKPFNLYNVIINNLDLDFNLLNFIFNYVDNILFTSAINVHFKIKDYINQKINKFETYYDAYLIWYNQVKGIVGTDEFLVNKISENDFENYLIKILQELQTQTTSQPIL